MAITKATASSVAPAAAGDLVYGSGTNDAAVLALGTAGQVLTVNSGATAPEWATLASPVVSEQVAGKNAIINGDFTINQRQFTSNTTTGSYNFDRWLQQNVGGTFTITPQSFTPGSAPIVDYEGQFYLQGVVASQSAVGDYAAVSQRIENVRRYANSTITISFFAKANTGTPKIGIELQQNFGTGGSPSSNVSTPVGFVTLSTSWARYDISITVPSISGKTLGTTANTSYLELNLFASAGSDFATRASSIGIQNFTFELWGVQVEYGSNPTYFTTASSSIAGELGLCQRYYQRASGSFIATGLSAGSTQAYAVVPFPNQMRRVSSVGASALRIYDGNGFDNATAGLASSDGRVAQLSLTGSGFPAAGVAISLEATYLEFIGEL